VPHDSHRIFLPGAARPASTSIITMNPTSIQWCHATINPVMGCDGCELWLPEPAFLNLATRLLSQIAQEIDSPKSVEAAFEATRTRFQFSRALGEAVPNPVLRQQLISELDRAAACYAGVLTTARAGYSSGYPNHFEHPTLYPGRMQKMARCVGVTEKHADKTWLKGMPFMLFVSDMGDALSKSISFTELEREIVKPVCSHDGRRHVWLWLTKRPTRMVEFADWLMARDQQWPKNLVPMTSITSEKSYPRIEALKKIPAAARGLSIEPLLEKIRPDLHGIDWVIVGGESGPSARPFHLEWAFDLRAKAKQAGCAFFLKQAGANPHLKGGPINLRDSHGGNWDEWSNSWRTREVPSVFKKLVNP
jgi:protein gp37